jgi:2-keto-4-pentenoate hydratase/2-oxohepta-3-ene-1,7-dioic acid hydratase in catechol pathway
MPLPIPAPSKIVCAGLNYRPHVDEVKLDLPERPLLFAKWPSSVVGDGEAILLPPQSRQVDYEAELAVVIGRDVVNVSRENALDAVLGYTCLNDVSARDLQFADGQWTRAKSFDTFCPLGPVLVPASEVADPQNVRVRCIVNDEIVQDDTTANMIFPIDELISYASASTTLRRGDVVATGTPAGVAFGSANPRWLTAGDIVTVDVEGIGVLTNPVRATH